MEYTPADISPDTERSNDMSDASKAAKARYKAKTIKTMYLDLNTKTDADIIQWLDRIAETGGSKSGEIKRACRKMKPKYSYLNLQKNEWQCPSCPAKYTPYPGHLISYCPACGQAIINATGKETPTPVDTEAATSTPVDTKAEYWYYGKNDWDTVTYKPTPEELEKARQIEKEEGRSKRNQYSAEVMENHFRRGIFSGIHYTPVDTAEASTPVDTEAATSTPVDTAEASTPVDTEAATSTPVDTAEASTPVDTQIKRVIAETAKKEGGKGDNWLISYVTKKGGETQRSAIFRGRTKKEAIQNFREWHKKRKEPFEGHAFRPEARRKFSKYGITLLTEPEREAEARSYGKSLEQWDKETEEFWRKVDEENAANAKKDHAPESA